MCSGTGMAHVIDLSYDPEYEELADFAARNTWLFTVLWEKVQTPSGREILRQTKEFQNGRYTLRLLDEEYNSSATAEIRASELLDLIVQTRLDNGWGKPYVDFISHMLDLMDQYNETVRYRSQRLSDEAKRSHLERAVEGVKALNDVRIRELQMVAHGHTHRLSFHRYVALLRDAAKICDKARGDRRRKPRQANTHDQVASPEQDDTTQDDPDMEEAYSQFQIWMASQSGARLSDDTWKSMSDSAKKSWGSIPAKDRATIIEGLAGSKSNRQANVHQQSSNDDNGDGSDDEGTDSNDDAQEANTKTEVNRTAQEVNETKGKTHPGDIRRVLGGPPKKKPASTPKGNAKGSANTVTWSVNHVGQTASREVDVDEFAETLRNSQYESIDSPEYGRWGVPDPQEAMEYLTSSNDEYWADQESQFFG